MPVVIIWDFGLSNLISRAVNAISKGKCNWKNVIFGFKVNNVRYEFYHASLLGKKE